MHHRIVLLTICLTAGIYTMLAQTVTVAGQVTDEGSKQPIEYASVLMKENGHWAVTDSDGRFSIKNIPTGKTTLTIQCLGYATRNITINITKDIPRLQLTLKQENLKLEGVTVTAHRKQDEATTSYTIDRAALDQQQIINLGDIATLLPGGKTSNPTLTDDTRLALRSGDSEKGNASFGTAIEIDGVRMDNNAMADETMGSSTRSISTSNVESVEIVTGIPSVEYGDLSNGIVKVNTRKGKSPFIIEGKINQHTYQIAANKGFELGGRLGGVLNASIEHARSFTNIASPHTSYQRNILSLHYMKVFMPNSTPLTLNIGLTGNIGGYNSEADPDRLLDEYTKVRDNNIRGNFDLNWLLNKPWITNLSLKGALSYADKKTTESVRKSSASTQPYIHATTEGYHIATDYDENPQADIILGPTGYWYQLGYNDQKPLTYSLKLKADLTRRFGSVLNSLKVGADYSGSKNKGRGTYYDDMRYAPTWREYRYDEQPALNSLSFYVEDKISLQTTKLSTLEVTAGLREDLTLIGGSDYGTVGSLSPRINGHYHFWRNRRNRWVTDFSIHAGWGKSVKLPSFQLLYPAPSYSDILVFTPGSTADNKAFYAYHTYPSKSLYNPDLKWQYTLQTDLGAELTVKGTRIAVSGFYHKTKHPYMAVHRYVPYEYKVTDQSAIEHLGVPSAERSYRIDQATGVVTLYDRAGNAYPLDYSTRRAYNSNYTYVNGSAVTRYGLEWMIDFAPFKALHTSLRLDGNYYYYKGVDETLFAGNTTGVGNTADRSLPLIGYYRGSSSTSTGTTASGAVANGSISKQLNLNATVTTHIPQIRMIVALRLECTFYDYKRQLSELSGGTRGIIVESGTDYFGTPYDGSTDKTVVVYPEYYSTWDNPTELKPFAPDFAAARDNNPQLYRQMAALVARNSYPYYFNPNRISTYYSANISVTKEIGNHVSLSFYANNFFNNMKTVHSSQTDLDTSLFGSSYIPSFYYGLALKLKL